MKEKGKNVELLSTIDKAKAEDVENLLKQITNIDAVLNDKGNTLLHLAVDKNKKVIVKLLLIKGINPYLKNHDGKTAFDIAITKESLNLDIIELLVSHSVYDRSYLYPSNYLEGIVDWRKKNIVSFNSNNRSLFVAIDEGNVSKVITALNKGVNINARYNENGWTALMFATFLGELDIVRSLLNHNINIEARNSSDLTALDMAVSFTKTNEQAFDIVKLLVFYGADYSKYLEDDKIPADVKGAILLANAASMQYLGENSDEPKELTEVVYKFTETQIQECIHLCTGTRKSENKEMERAVALSTYNNAQSLNNIIS